MLRLIHMMRGADKETKEKIWLKAIEFYRRLHTPTGRSAMAPAEHKQ